MDTMEYNSSLIIPQENELTRLPIFTVKAEVVSNLAVHHRMEIVHFEDVKKRLPSKSRIKAVVPFVAIHKVRLEKKFSVPKRLSKTYYNSESKRKFDEISDLTLIAVVRALILLLKKSNAFTLSASHILFSFRFQRKSGLELYVQNNSIGIIRNIYYLRPPPSSVSS